ncbi:hypothetical protein GCM10010124_07900 [Pilimelia terevasa]|uniref:Hydrolase n=1 Tax=Pilimelia terevasa TaxID=53372 RepID=A0A8J3BP42_9ACTN|nr:hydrolase [Pilimelia terevasa]GGK17747.1 hypothetical protein GCM10010124_07900 [Pilimelia terevasa]
MANRDLVTPLIDLNADAHVHTGFSVGRDSVGAIVTAAERVGLRQLTFADIVSPRVNWLPVYQKSILRAQQRTDVDLRMAVEVDVVRADGWLDFPEDLGGLDALSVSVGRLPVGGALLEPRRVAEALRAGELRAVDVVDLAVQASVHAVERASRYAPTQLARPLSLLAQVGLDLDELDDSVFAPLVEACRCSGTAVEVSESWRAPAGRLAGLFAAAGVPLLAASDARDVAQLGQWRFVARLLSSLAMAEAQRAAA